LHFNFIFVQKFSISLKNANHTIVSKHYAAQRPLRQGAGSREQGAGGRGQGAEGQENGVTVQGHLYV